MIGSVDQPDVAERLWKVAEQLATPDVDLFGEQAEVVGEAGNTVVQGVGFACRTRFGEAALARSCR